MKPLKYKGYTIVKIKSSECKAMIYTEELETGRPIYVAEVKSLTIRDAIAKAKDFIDTLEFKCLKHRVAYLQMMKKRTVAAE